MRIESQLFELKRHIEAAGVIAPSFFHWLSVDRWRPLRSAAGCSRTLPGGGVRRRARRGWHVIAKCEDGNSGHHDPDDKCRQEPSAAVSVTERSLSVGVQAWIGLLRLSAGGDGGRRSPDLPAVRNSHVVCGSQRLPRPCSGFALVRNVGRPKNAYAVQKKRIESMELCER
jgi:hypothetical protein